MTTTSIWRGLTRNLGWRLGSLMLAILLWMATVGQPELVTTHTVPILYKDLPANLLIGSEALDAVRLELRGSAPKLTSASLADLAITLNLADVKDPGQRTFTLSGSELHLPSGVTFLRAVPSQLRVDVVRKIEREVSVAIQIGTPPAMGYHIASQDVTPATVRIAGPERRVATIAEAETDAIDLSKITGLTEIRVNAFVADSHVWLESPSLVTVRVNIEKDKPTNN
jgi:YbbR domain-containing protein